jgi:GntR family transcriptional regulator
MFVKEGATGRLMSDERSKFLKEEWPKVAATIERLGLSAEELLAQSRDKDGKKDGGKGR